LQKQRARPLAVLFVFAVLAYSNVLVVRPAEADRYDWWLSYL